MDPTGIAMALGARFSFAIYALASKNVLKGMEPVAAVAVVFSLSACYLFPFLLFFDLSYITVPGNFWLLIYLGIGATNLSYILFSFGLKQIPSSFAVTLSLAEPLTVAILGVLVVGEALSGLSWIGVGLLLFGIIVLTMGRKGKLSS
ncbi:EamA family transporter [Planococcus antarcticus]|uniref:EamA family transporter n=1 Tax=Planococcus antarcticus TaxID=161360 RepID=UPI000312585B|nr:EamA family transporter [Planococcus antarcticus]